MTLPFMTTFPKGLERIGGQPTNFIPKIWKGLVTNGVEMNAAEYLEKWNELSADEKQLVNTVSPKLHSFRRDEHKLWKPGRVIHAVINNRTPQRRQFIPAIKCINVQEIWIHPHNKSASIWRLDDENSNPDSVLEGYWEAISSGSIDTMAINDGFQSTEDFFAYFNREWAGNIIHYTDLKY